MQEELACTLGHLQHHEEIPDLIELLRRRDTWREAECALGNLAVTEAVQRAIDAETDTELANRMERSLHGLTRREPCPTK